MEQLNLFKSEKKRDAGIKQAIDSAESKDYFWPEKALDFVRQYPGNKFMTEEVRDWAHRNGLPHPPNSRAWGAVILRAKKTGLIIHGGFGFVSNPKAHRTPAAIWVKL